MNGMDRFIPVVSSSKAEKVINLRHLVFVDIEKDKNIFYLSNSTTIMVNDEELNKFMYRVNNIPLEPTIRDK